MKEEVLSRTHLLQIIENFGLYGKERKSVPPERIIELMRRNIDIEPLNPDPERRDFNAIRISFTTESARLAQEVTGRLTSLFIEENLKTREDQARNTTVFLSEQLKVVAKRLLDKEQQLRDYKMQHLGELPEQQQGNVAILGGLQSQLQNAESALSRAQQQRAYLESLLNDYRRASRVAVISNNSGNRPLTPLQAARTELAHLQSIRDNLLDRYTSEHPDVKRAEAEIARQQRVVDGLRASEAPQVETGNARPNSSTDPDDDVAVAQIKSQLEANRLEIDSLSNDQKRLKATAADYQNRLGATPVREQQLAEVLRDYDLLKKEYADLLSKEQQSQLAASLEKQQGGLQFRLVDPPSLPTVPSSPKRIKFSLGGIAGGIVLGLALAFLRDMMVPSFHTEEELQARFEFPVVGVPLLFTPQEKRNQRWRNVFEWVAASMLAMAVLGAEFLIYRRG